MIKLVQVNKCDEDAKLIMEWRNDIHTLINSFRTVKYTWEEFIYIFHNNYFKNSINPLFATLNNEKIAFIGFNDTNKKTNNTNNTNKTNNTNNTNKTNMNDTIEISLNINPQFRGKKLSVSIIQETIQYIKNNYSNIKKINALIKYFNAPSLQIFKKSNFEFKEKIIINNENIHVYQYEMNKNNIQHQNQFVINNRKIGKDYSTYIIAEMSCNHNQNKKNAFKLIDAAAEAGADAIKLQTYTQDTLTLNCNKPVFKECLKGSLWEGQTLYQLYSKAYTPWEWHKDLKDYANSKGLDLFSSPFDTTSVDFLESINMPAYKIASFELTDHILLKRVAQTKKPVIISSGMASLNELNDAIEILRNNGTTQIAMLKCTSAYPACPEDANLNTIKHMTKTFNVIGGLSDHTLGIEVPIASVVLGGRIIEKHFKLIENSESEDDAFSLTPEEFKKMVNSVRIVEKSLGIIKYSGTNKETNSKKFRRSLFVVQDIKKGGLFNQNNIKSIRPSNGLHTKYYDEILGKEATENIEYGTPLNWNLIKINKNK